MAHRIPQRLTQRLDRRHFLLGAGGAALALPMLEAFAPRVAFGQLAAPPKRLVMLHHAHGRVVGGRDASEDNWSPSSQTGPLPTSGDISPLLSAIGDVRQEIVTLDGVDNLVRHMTGDADGHASAELTCHTCAVPPMDLVRAGGPSIDYVAAQRLRASQSQRASILFPSGPVPGFITESGRFFDANGVGTPIYNPNPDQAARELFGTIDAMNDAEPPAQKTLADRLAARRPSVLDAVAKNFEAVRKQVGAADRERLDQHAAFLQALEAQASGGGSLVPTESCGPPDLSTIPTQDQFHDDSHDWSRGFDEAVMWQYEVENLVQSLACDITRVSGFQFLLDYVPVFPSEFDGTSPFDGDSGWHANIHDTDSVDARWAADITRAYQFYGKVFTRLVQRLAAIVDTDGGRLLDNTLVLWVSDLGYGAAHHSWNHPIVMAGLGSAFANGQGRHVVCDGRRSLGDFYAQVLRMFGGSDSTFGQTGKIGASGVSGDELMALNGAPDFISVNTPLHLGELDL